MERLVKSEIEFATKKGDRLGANGTPALPAVKSSYYRLVSLYAHILMKSGKYEQALTYAKEAYDGLNGKDDRLSGTYGILLNKNMQDPQALLILEKLVTRAKANSEMKQALKESYTRVNPKKDASVYLAGLEKDMQTNVAAEVSKLLLNEASPNFVVKDVNGKVVSLADFKGKTIVLDFWATWCGPCTKSFPAMQMVVNKYEKDPNTKFLFIHTWERVADPLTDAKDFLSKNNYKFDLYMDSKDAATQTNLAISAFGVKGIPAKFVIDGNGKIRFRVIGFSSGDDAAVAELSAMIEISKKQA